MLRKDQTDYYKYWKAPLKKTNHLVPMAEHVERKLVEKNWKTPLNIDDESKNKSFLSLLESGSFNIKLDKDSIRVSVGEKRSVLSQTEVEEKSLVISDYLYSLEVFKLSKSIALYFPISNEVRTESIFIKAIQSEKEVYFPRVNGSSLDFHRVDNLEQLEKGEFGVLEPKAHFLKAQTEDIDLFILPALAYDKSGNRLGYGKGYYDRSLANIPERKKIGLSYDMQVLDSLPTDEFDRKVGIVVTELGVVF